MGEQIGAVIVAYNPEIESFKCSINIALTQVDKLVVVNNGERSLQSLFSFLTPDKAINFQIIENVENLGMAVALNQGISFLIDKKCRYFLFLDQDSCIPDGMILSLQNTFKKLRLNNVNIAAIGPSFFDLTIQKTSPFIRFSKCSLDLDFGSSHDPLVFTHLLITSGTFTSLDVINKVGLMNEGFFIDNVDNEWCLRALSKGYKLIGDFSISMNHAIGGDPLILLNKKYHNHSPLRHYYFVRNSVHLFKSSYIPYHWRINILLIAIKLFIFYCLVSDERINNFFMMSKGFIDGTKGKFGRYDLSTKKQLSTPKVL